MEESVSATSDLTAENVGPISVILTVGGETHAGRQKQSCHGMKRGATSYDTTQPCATSNLTAENVGPMSIMLTVVVGVSS